MARCSSGVANEPADEPVSSFDGATEMEVGFDPGGVHMPASPYPDGVTPKLARRWFDSSINDGQTIAFDDHDAVSKLWLGLGRFPSLVWTDDFDTRTYFRFADGTVIWRPNPQADYRMLQIARRALGPHPDGGVSYPEGVSPSWPGIGLAAPSTTGTRSPSTSKTR